MMLSVAVSLAAAVTFSASVNGAWTRDTFKHGVYFGDSYTASMKFIPIHNWVVDVTTLSGSEQHDYAISGSSCSSAIIGGELPSIKEKQLPKFQKELKTKNLNLPANDTVYAIWIGTNDLGAMGLLPKADGPAKVPDYVECVFDAFDTLYTAGGRKFVLMNVDPLDLLPMYTVPKGNGADTLYPNKPTTAEGLKQADEKLRGMVIESNALFANGSQAAFNGSKPRYPGAEMALFDVHRFVSIMAF
jgi:hypothetical protein